MATIVNNPPANVTESDSSLGIVIGVVLLAVLLFALFSLGVFRGIGSGQTNVNNGAGDEAPQINVPDRVDVNIQ